MRQCPTCSRSYSDDSLRFCLDDGTPLSAANDPDTTLVMSQTESPTKPAVSTGPAARSNQKLFYVAIAIGALLLGGGVVAILKSTANDAPARNGTTSATPAAQSTATPTPHAREWTVTVPMASPWTCTNVEVKDGQTLTITASGRGVWKNVAQSYPKAFEECGPDGTPPVDSADYYSNISSYQCPDAYKGALIGKVGQNGNPFLVGSNFSRTLTETGTLCLGINDMKPQVDSTAFRDNSGAFTARIRLSD